MVPDPALRYPFGDLRVVTSAWQSMKQGLDPLRYNPCDPDLLPMNYPRVWLLPGRLGLDDGATVLVGVVVGLAFLVSVLVLFKKTAWPGGSIALLSVCSPACLLLVERANIDIVVFVYVVAAAELSPRGRRKVWALVPIVVASVLSCTRRSVSSR